MDMNKSLLIGIGVLLILGGILYIAFSGNSPLLPEGVAQRTATTTVTEQSQQNSTTSAAAQNTQASTGATAQNSAAVPNSVTLSENKGGNIMTVASARLSQPGYVVLYKINSNGGSSMVGHSDLLSAGTHSNIAIQLDSVAASRQAIVAVLDKDNGDGSFDVGEDLYLLNPGDLLVSDIDVVDVARADREGQVLASQVQAYLDENFTARSSAQ
jgi:hypothetical protein